MHVKAGQENYIDYSFTRCHDRGASADRPAGICANVETLEKGVLVLTVSYEEIHAEGLKEIHKKPEECGSLTQNLKALFKSN